MSLSILCLSPRFPESFFSVRNWNDTERFPFSFEKYLFHDLCTLFWKMKLKLLRKSSTMEHYLHDKTSLEDCFCAFWEENVSEEFTVVSTKLLNHLKHFSALCKICKFKFLTNSPRKTVTDLYPSRDCTVLIVLNRLYLKTSHANQTRVGIALNTNSF